MTNVVSTIVEAIATEGYAIVANALPSPVIAALRERALALEARGELAPAGIGRGAERTTRPDVRGDRIRWLDREHPAAAERPAWQFLDALREAANRTLMLGLWSFEGHYALYPPGASYARHRDRFRDNDARVLSCILYLNESWQVDDGGVLRMCVADGVMRDVLPDGGTLVSFLADRFEHEVLPATRARLALTGWFRRRD